MKFKYQTVNLFLFFCFLTVSCSKDIYENPSNSLQSEKKFISYEDFKRHSTAFNVYEKLNSSNTNNLNNISSNNQTRLIYNEAFNFFINTDKILFFSNENLTTFTFEIYRNRVDFDKKENLVISVKDNTIYECYIAEYSFNDNEINQLNQGFSLSNITDKLNLKTLNNIQINNNYGGTIYHDVYGNCYVVDKINDLGNGEIETTFIQIKCPESLDSGPSTGGSNSGGVNVIIIGGGSSINIGSGQWMSIGGGGNGEFNTIGNINIITDNPNSSSIPFLITSPVLADNTNSGLNFVLVKELKKYINLTNQQFNFLLNNNSFSSHFLNYLETNNFNSESIEFIEWSLNFIIENSDITYEEFENFFMRESEGLDGEYNENYWSDPNLTFPTQTLPSFDNFKNSCPSKYKNGLTVCTEIGGELLTMYNQVTSSGNKFNTCAIRISRALNYSGVTIPALPDNPNGTKNTVQGMDGKNYIINAKVLNSWLRKTFGTNNSNYHHFDSTQAGVKGKNFVNLTAGMNGIYSMVALPSIQSTWGSGHVDIIENGNCWLGSHFFDPNNNFIPVNYIDIWILD
ncbi:Type VI secretion system (T6SS), amidase effector protein 4 [Flavobacterium fontis]|uniref:Type VI secretion system (T6SS), amidase effector protein 4 n=1 Tax=Flavobacterium fontis TaxID=1124188 RepID=A0A1M5CAZ6_9FLAO|nr:T6SS effector amidase Tae4 family protein [Flavobacterium fontis]SHF51592.1 Type VI secretion system (T6SS), amidase effector protein 4 [Flavobacterium fontis]